jgi:hypothetical protein
MRSTCLFILVVGVTSLCHAQSPPAKSKANAKAEAARVAEQRRVEARAVLISLASDARSFRDQELRARSVARIAAALWEGEPDRARTLFRQAWEAAVAVAQEDTQRANLRVEILTLIAPRDRRLAEELLQKLQAHQPEKKVENSHGDRWGLPDELQQRLNLAARLLEAGDTQRALQFADPILNTVNISTLDFLTSLRAKDPAAADQRYASLLTNPSGVADANTISLLSSYLFTPRRYVTFNSSGPADGAWPPFPIPPPNVSPQLRLAFFQTAVGVLLRTSASPEQDQNTVENYLVMKLLLPVFEQYAPRELTEAMRGQFSALDSQVSDAIRTADSERAQQELGIEKSSVDREQPLLKDLEHAKTSEDRDHIYFRLALIALSKDDAKAHEYAGRIEDGDFRKQAEAWVDWGFALQAIEKKKAAAAVELVHAAELNHIQKVWILTQAAKLLAKTDRDQALLLLDEANAEARRIDGGDLDRPRAFLAIANAVNVVVRARVWEAIFDAVKAANSTESFTGEDDVLPLTASTRGHILNRRDAFSDFILEGIFREVANNDFDRALQLARGFRAEAPRANATLAICQAVLSGTRSTRE